MQIFISLRVFGALAHEVAEAGAVKFPQFTWTASNEPMVWPEHLADDQWEAQQWLHDQVEAVTGGPVAAAEVDPAAAPQDAPRASGAQEPSAGPFRAEEPPSPPPELVRFFDFAQETAKKWLALQVAALSPRLTFEATGAELAVLFRARADAAELEAAEVEKEAAAPVPDDPNPYDLPPMPLVPPAAAPRKRGKAAEQEADPKGGSVWPIAAMAAQVEAARAAWDAQRDERNAQKANRRAAVVKVRTAALRSAATRDRWAADHLTPTRVYVLGPKEIGVLFPDAAIGNAVAFPFPLGQ